MRRRRWQPMRRGEIVPPEASLDAARSDPRVARLLAESKEVWLNNLYVVIVKRNAEGQVASLSIRRQDRKPIRDWRHLQQIKNEIAGEDVEAIDLHPASKRLVDVANQTWLWCFPPGVLLPVGFPERFVAGPHDEVDVPAMGWQQRDFQEGLNL